MATTTPNYGWAVPTSTDLVKDGATAIETLGDAIDASMNTALGTKKAGMVLLNTTSFSGVSSQIINNVFSADYNNYRVMMNFDPSASSYVSITARLRSSGTDASGANYSYYGMYVDSGGGPTRDAGTNSTEISIADANTGGGLTTIDISNAFLAKRTFFNITRNNSTSANTGFQFFLLGGCHNVTTSYDGISFFFASSLSGTIRIYGYNN